MPSHYVVHIKLCQLYLNNIGKMKTKQNKRGLEPDRVPILALTFTACINLGKLLHPSVPQFPTNTFDTQRS